MDKTRTIAITGTNGLVGYQAYEFFRTHTSWKVIGISRTEGKCVDNVVDLTSESAIRELRSFIQPDVLIHTAAISRTDACERDRTLCYATNVTSTKNLIKYFPETKFIYFSTYAVYDTPDGNCVEECETKAANHYIQTKIDGESYVKQQVNYVIFRPSVIFGFVDYQQASKNYLMQLLDNVRERRITRSPKDQYFNPILVDIVIELLFRTITEDITGIYNVGSNDKISKFEFNRNLMDFFHLDPSLLEGIDSASLDVKRPSMGTISSDHIQEVLSYSIPSLTEMITRLEIKYGERVFQYISGIA